MAGCGGSAGPGEQPPAGRTSPIARQYRAGERITYHMTGSNRGPGKTARYEADARGVVVEYKPGSFVEEFEWSNLIVDNRAVTLPAAADAVRQRLSLEQGYRLSVPDLSKAHPSLIGPITDLLTFYADYHLAGRDGKLVRPGDQFYVKHGKPNSWAHGPSLLIGEDAIDFDVRLAEIDPATRTATVVVRHVPPEEPHIKQPAAWTRAPVADAPNNWIQVIQAGPGRYLGQVGKETFDVRLAVSLDDGRLMSGTMRNLVEVTQRECKDPDLSSPGEPVRYEIRRDIEVHEVAGGGAGRK
jgi:hypothetical protein